jgi:[ribosomal protein S18]-alanine N-acetyltransferase
MWPLTVLMKLKFSRMKMPDIPEVMALELATFTSPWTEDMFTQEVEHDLSVTILAREEGNALAGFICFWVLVDEMHIMNLAVRSDLRGRGIGKRLVKRAMVMAGKRGAKSATLEVRESNRAAISLYEGFGFVVAGRRKNYYDMPKENAVIMWLYDMRATGPKTP